MRPLYSDFLSKGNVATPCTNYGEEDREDHEWGGTIVSVPVLLRPFQREVHVPMMQNSSHSPLTIRTSKLVCWSPVQSYIGLKHGQT
jgi:hypothetical protein